MHAAPRFQPGSIGSSHAGRTGGFRRILGLRRTANAENSGNPGHCLLCSRRVSKHAKGPKSRDITLRPLAHKVLDARRRAAAGALVRSSWPSPSWSACLRGPDNLLAATRDSVRDAGGLGWLLVLGPSGRSVSGDL